MEATPVSGQPEAKSEKRATLLLVDDDEHVRRALRRVLRRTQCEILEAPDAAVGLERLTQEPVQVVVSDYRMPGISGVEFLRLVKEKYPRIQRVLLTGQADTSAIEEAVNQSEIFRFIWKPWDDSHLLLTIQSAVDQFFLQEENQRLEALLTTHNAELESLNRELDQKLEARTAALKRAADEWRTCFDAISDPMVILRDCQVMRANAAFARHAKVSVTCLPDLHCVQHAFGDLPCPTPHLAGHFEREITFQERPWLLRSFPFDEEGASVVTYKDVTDERDVARRLFQAEKMAAVGQLAGGVAHEINNPLGGILAFAQIMSREQRTPEDLEYLNLINDAALRAKRIVESLLRFSRRPREDERGDVDLPRVVEDALFLVQAQFKDRQIELVRDLQPATVHGNANQLQQVVVNLVVNAIQAIDGQGTVEIRTGRTPEGRAELRVSDNGPGIPLEIAARVFEPFFTTKPEGKGTGLGLSICYQIAEEHGGTIRLERAALKGACFVVDLPTAPTES